MVTLTRRTPGNFTASALARFLILVGSYLTLACSPSEDPARPKVQTIFVHGDPMQLVSGATLNPHPFFTADNLDALQDFELFNLTEFRNRSRAKPKPPPGEAQAQLERENSGSSGPAPDSRYEFSTDSESVRFEPINPIFQFPTFTFRSVDNRGLELHAVNGYPVVPLHFSWASDKRSFSILFAEGLAEPESTKRIIAAYFIKKSHPVTTMPLVEEDHDYLLGPGRTTAWRKPIKAHLCGQTREDYAQTVTEAAWAWSKAGRVGQMPLKLETKTSFAPFSDLNENCIRLIEDFYFERAEWASILGLTIPVIDPYQREILGASVFISLSGIRKIAGDVQLEVLEHVAKHEFGHFLGLGHEFERGTDGQYLKRSIMGYEFDLNISDFDRHSIRFAYGNYPSFGEFGERPSADAPDYALLPFYDSCQRLRSGESIANTESSGSLESEAVQRAELQKTLQAIQNVVGGSSCEEVAYRLADRTELPLEKLSLSDLRPLSGLTKVTNLNLTLNDVEDLTPLASLTSLERLMLGGNRRLSDLTALSRLTQLRHLDIADTAVERTGPYCPRSEGISPALRDVCSLPEGHFSSEGT